MAQENRISITFTKEEEKIINDAFAAIMGVLESKVISLQPHERQLYGRVKYEKEVFIDNIKMEMERNPHYIPAWVNEEEYSRDYAAHKVLNPLIAAIEKIYQQMLDTNLLLGYDLDTGANAFYQNVKTAAKANAPGARTIYENLKQQYPGGKSKGSAAEPPKK